MKNLKDSKDFSKIHTLNFLAFLTICILLAVAAYLQVSKGLRPCPLCSVQRFLMIVLAIIFLAGSFYKRMSRTHLYGAVITFFSLLGIAAAGRQIYLHLLPPSERTACAPAKLTYILKKFSWLDSVKVIFRGSAGCGEVTWTFLNLSIPEWSLMFFILFLLIGMWELFFKTK